MVNKVHIIQIIAEGGNSIAFTGIHIIYNTKYSEGLRTREANFVFQLKSLRSNINVLKW